MTILQNVDNKKTSAGKKPAEVPIYYNVKALVISACQQPAPIVRHDGSANRQAGSK